MPLSLNEIRSRTIQFANDWKDEKRERAEKDTFWNEFFNIFGLNRKRLATFEEPAKRLNGKGVDFIDLFWKGVLIAEHKSAGKDLQSAFEQATDYFHGLKDVDLPEQIEQFGFLRSPQSPSRTRQSSNQSHRKEPFKSDTERVEFLFERCGELLK